MAFKPVAGDSACCIGTTATGATCLGASDRDPYRVWLSEIMLQQTRVAAVLEHYHRFLKRFPTVQKLASARESSVLATWSGLGYYRRARMMHAAAKVIVKQHGGKFPGGIAELRALPGIGRYTAAAIASIVFNAPAAVVDGNVERVLGRVFGTGLAGEPLWQAAEAIAKPTASGRFQPGHDGTRSNRMPAPPAAMFDLPGIQPVRHARNARCTAESRPSEAARYLLCARSSRPLNFSGAAAETRIPDAGHVGVAGSGRVRAGFVQTASPSGIRSR